MVTIKRETLQEFFRKTSGIKVNENMSVLGYILLEVGGGKASLTKTNLSSYCRYEFPCDGKMSILLETITLSTIVQATESETIDIVLQEDGNILLTDGAIKLTFESFPVVDFPVFPKKSGSKTVIPFEVIEAMSIAKAYAEPDPKRYPTSHVHSTNNDIFAIDGMCLYHKRFDTVIREGKDVPVVIPKLCVSQDAIGLLSGYQTDLSHYCSGNIDFFCTEDTIYGFTQMADTRQPGVENFLKTDKDNGFRIRKALIEKFCETTMAISTLDKTPVCYIKDGGEGIIKLSYNNAEIRKTNELPVIVQEKKGVFDQFTFNPRVILSAIKALPYEYLYIGRSPLNKNYLSVWNADDTKYTGFFAGINNL